MDDKAEQKKDDKKDVDSQQTVKENIKKGKNNKSK